MHICGNAYHKRTYDGGIQGVCPVDNCRNIYNDNMLYCSCAGRLLPQKEVL